MPPKKLSKKKQAEQAEAIIRETTENATKLFIHHEKERNHVEMVDRTDLDTEIFISVLEKERLQNERVHYDEIYSSIAEEKRLVFLEHDKHMAWKDISEDSWLPSVHSESDINTFITCWKEIDSENNFPRNESSITVELKKIREGTPKALLNGVESELEMCHHAKSLWDLILLELDKAIVNNDFKNIMLHRHNLQQLNLQLIKSIDKVTSTILRYSDVFFEGSEETLVRWCPKKPNELFPEGEKEIRMGIWTRTKIGEMTRHLPSLKFNDIGVLLEPKEGSQRLPRALGLSKDNVAFRVVQMNFDPFSIFVDLDVGQQYIALDYVLIVNPLVGHERAKVNGDFCVRVNAPASHILTAIPYRPDKEEASDNGELRLSFQVPHNIVLRHLGDPQVGVWNDQKRQWEPLKNRCSQMVIRRTTLVTDELATMAIIQEKGFDVPYTAWQLYPLTDDQVLFVIEGRDDRGESLQDREVRILVRGHECKLFAPSAKPELRELRENWYSPPTMLRKLAKAGYNFLLNDMDSEYIDIKPKSSEMEQKGYEDISLFCTTHGFTNSKHNKVEVVRENSNLTLFRISIASREEGSSELVTDIYDDTKWHSVRYERDRCVLAAFRDIDEVPDLSNEPGKDTHLNLMTMLCAESDDPSMVETTAREANKLLQASVYQLLILTRPFSWG